MSPCGSPLSSVCSAISDAGGPSYLPNISDAVPRDGRRPVGQAREGARSRVYDGNRAETSVTSPLGSQENDTPNCSRHVRVPDIRQLVAQFRHRLESHGNAIELSKSAAIVRTPSQGTERDESWRWSEFSPRRLGQIASAVPSLFTLLSALTVLLLLQKAMRTISLFLCVVLISSEMSESKSTAIYPIQILVVVRELVCSSISALERYWRSREGGDNAVVSYCRRRNVSFFSSWQSFSLIAPNAQTETHDGHCSSAELLVPVRDKTSVDTAACPVRFTARCVGDVSSQPM
ncbi:hypothetical protein CBL_01220 [Carabus blaptoides fortunei]